MKKLFQHIRRQPKSVRDNYALGFSAAFTLAVFFVWLVAFPGLNVSPVEVANDAETKQKPFATFFKQSKEQLASLISAFGQAEEGTEEGSKIDDTKVLPGGIILTDEDRRIVEDKKSDYLVEEATSTPPTHNEVLIGTTTVSGSLEAESSP